MIQEGNLWKGLVSYTEDDVIEGRYIFSGRHDITLALLLPEEAAEPFAQTLRELSAGRLVPEKVGSVFRGVLRK